MTGPRASWTEDDLHRRDLLRPLAQRWGCSTGQVWTLLIGAVLGSALLVSSVLRGPGVPQDAATAAALPLALLQPAPAPLPGPRSPTPSVAPVESAVTTPVAPLLGPLLLPAALSFGFPPVTGLPLVAAPAGSMAPVETPGRALSAPTLTIREGGWYARTAAPVNQARGFAVNDYPVAADAAGDSRHSFVRLAGAARTLVLAVDTASTATYGAALAHVLACSTTDAGWQPRPEQRLAPAYNAQRCVTGRPAVDGSRWSFDLSRLPDPTGVAGITLVADLSQATTGAFQITFLPSTGVAP